MPLLLKWKREADRGTEPIEILKETPISAYILGHRNLGPLVAKKAMDIAIEKANKNFLGFVGVNSKFTYITADYNPERAAKQGLIGISCSVAYPSTTVYGAEERLIGANPIAVAIPSSDRIILLDMAISEMVGGKIEQFYREGKPLPEGVALSKEGDMTTSSAEALAGALIPFGNVKGSALGIITDLLAGPLLGATAGKSVNGNRGMVFMAIKPGIFVSEQQFLADVATFVDEVKKAKLSKGFQEVFLPGELGFKSYDSAVTKGIRVDSKLYSELKQTLDNT
jgi:L-2-hydroxycarboxylate dehydrogenase (NAD+)